MAKLISKIFASRFTQISLFTLVLTTLHSCSENDSDTKGDDAPNNQSDEIVSQENMLTALQGLEGNWVGTKNEFCESWLLDENGLHGYGIYLDSAARDTFETLSIQYVDDQWIYYANVKGENDGNTIAFIADTISSSVIRFTNYEHNFPKVIEYVISNDTLNVKAGDGGSESVHFTMIRQ